MFSIRLSVVFSISVFFFSGSYVVLAQTNASSTELELTSWKKGQDRINPSVLEVDFGSEELDYDVFSADGSRRFRLNFRKQFISTINRRSYQCAVVGLKEATPSKLPGGVDLGLELLDDDDPITTPPSIICPVASPSVFEKNIVPFRSVRVFIIEGFVVRISPKSFSYHAEYNLLSALKVTITFENRGGQKRAST